MTCIFWECFFVFDFFWRGRERARLLPLVHSSNTHSSFLPRKKLGTQCRSPRTVTASRSLEPSPLPHSICLNRKLEQGAGARAGYPTQILPTGTHTSYLPSQALRRSLIGLGFAIVCTKITLSCNPLSRELLAVPA